MRQGADALLEARRLAAEASKGHSHEAIYRLVLSTVSQLPHVRRALDVGAGDGSLSRELARLCDQVVAADLVDYDGIISAPTVEWIRADLNESLPFAHGTFDLVVAAEVIEHLENPRFLAREWARVLEPGGHVIVTTPNNESWRSVLSLAVRGHFAAFTGNAYPAHITALTRSDLSRVLVEAGFEDPLFSFTNYGSIPKLTRTTWQKVSAGRLRGLRYSDNLCCSARKRTSE